MRPQYSILKPLMAVQVTILSIMLAALACTSKDTLFIHLTDTPTPTITPTPLSQETRYKIGDKLFLVSATFVIDLSEKPAPVGEGVFSSGNCSPNQEVTIEDVSKNTTDPKDTSLYYRVSCSGTGWVPEYIMTRLEQFASAMVKSKDGKGALVYTEPSMKSKPASDTPCPDGTKVSIDALTLNPDTAILRAGEKVAEPDYNIYAQLTCGGTSGYIVESLLEPAH